MRTSGRALAGDVKVDEDSLMIASNNIHQHCFNSSHLMTLSTYLIVLHGWRV